MCLRESEVRVFHSPGYARMLRAEWARRNRHIMKAWAMRTCTSKVGLLCSRLLSVMIGRSWSGGVYGSRASSGEHFTLDGAERA